MSLPLWLRSLVNTLLLPGVVAGVIPVLIGRGQMRWPLTVGAAHWLGLLPLAAGIAILFLTIWDFGMFGRGTLAPWDAPKALVHQRLYAYVRNPMYLGVLSCILGQALLWQCGDLLLYLGLIWLMFHVRVVWFEEPVLRRQFGASYQQYLTRVPRWIPRRPAR